MNKLAQVGYSICVLMLLFSFLSHVTTWASPVRGYLCPKEEGIQIPVVSKTSSSGAILFYGENRYRRVKEIKACRRAELPSP